MMSKFLRFPNQTMLLKWYNNCIFCASSILVVCPSLCLSWFWMPPKLLINFFFFFIFRFFSFPLSSCSSRIHGTYFTPDNTFVLFSSYFHLFLYSPYFDYFLLLRDSNISWKSSEYLRKLSVCLFVSFQTTFSSIWFLSIKLSLTFII